jgi:hypothetical protein
MTMSVASLRSQSSGILNVLTTYASGALLLRALGCSLLATAHGWIWRKPHFKVQRDRRGCAFHVIPVKTGIQSLSHTWTPGFSLRLIRPKPCGGSVGVTIPFIARARR